MHYSLNNPKHIFDLKVSINCKLKMRLTLVVVQASCFYTLCTALTAAHWNGISVLLTFTSLNSLFTLLNSLFTINVISSVCCIKSKLHATCILQPSEKTYLLLQIIVNIINDTEF